MTTNIDLAFEHLYPVQSYEPRMDGRIAIPSVCNYLQDIASRHADTLGFGYHDLEKCGHFWMLARLHVTMERLPRFGESCRIETWPSGNERLVALRDFLLHDEKGLIGKATTSWVTVNTTTHKPDNPETVLNRRFIPKRDRATIFPTKAIKRLKGGEHDIRLVARRSDMDINNHVNNVHYVEFCLEAIPRSWEEKNRCLGIDIQFRSESHAGDEYVSACAPADPDGPHATFLHSLTRLSDGREVVRMRSWWIQA
ncbi:acyl-[acyl-carrier-protein] thioesterase [Pseudodesulfovibrio piezophilus]|nr:acyl-ACP thioesterase domain-containing protein [Pseudodesulfovibrio piezophilus]